MASWLKAAEDLFEVVDRRAKLAVGETLDEQPVPTPGSSGRESQTKRSRQRAKKKLSANNSPAPVTTEREQQTTPETPQSHAAEPDGNILTPSTNETNASILRGKTNNSDRDDSITDTSLSGTKFDDEAKPSGDDSEVEITSNAEAVSSNTNGNEFPDIPVESPSNAAKVPVNVESPADPGQNVPSEDANLSRSIELSESHSPRESAPNKADTQLKDVDAAIEADTQIKKHQDKENVAYNQVKKHQDKENVASSTKVEEQLDEAQGLLKSANSTGQSKEARLARVCAGLSSRLQEYKSENAQLEELLMAERELSKSFEAQIKQLQKDLSASKGEVNRVESNMLEALASKNAEIETLTRSAEALKKQSALSEGNLASLQASMESIMRNRELTETRMMQALREELAATERRAEQEHSAHNATKLAAREREADLEQRAIESSTALARIQRTADDRAAKAAELEQKLALLEVECASLNQELQDMEARVRRGQKKAPEDPNQAIQVQAWQEEVERARQGQREAESKLSSMEAEVQKMRVEMAAMKRDAEHYSRQEHMELEKRYRELTDLLYYKQTQLETMASEKAAAEFQLEKEVKRLHESHLEMERNRVSRRASSSWEEDTDMKALEPLPLHHRHMATASVQLQKAAKLLDTGAVRATRFLWRYPTARLILLFYLVFVHLFLMYLLHRLQEQADNFTSKEVAESMGLFNQTLP